MAGNGWNVKLALKYQTITGLTIIALLLLSGCSSSEKIQEAESGTPGSDLTVVCLPAEVKVGEEVNCEVKVNQKISQLNIIQFTINAGEQFTINGLTESLGIVFNPANGKGVLTSAEGLTIPVGDTLFSISLQAAKIGESQVQFSNFKALSGADENLVLTTAQSNTITVS